MTGNPSGIGGRIDLHPIQPGDQPIAPVRLASNEIARVGKVEGATVGSSPAEIQRAIDDYGLHTYDVIRTPDGELYRFRTASADAFYALNGLGQLTPGAAPSVTIDAGELGMIEGALVHSRVRPAGGLLSISPKEDREVRVYLMKPNVTIDEVKAALADDLKDQVVLKTEDGRLYVFESDDFDFPSGASHRLGAGEALKRKIQVDVRGIGGIGELSGELVALDNEWTEGGMALVTGMIASTLCLTTGKLRAAGFWLKRGLVDSYHTFDDRRESPNPHLQAMSEPLAGTTGGVGTAKKK